MLSNAIVLGPQRREPIVCEALDDLVGDRKQSVAVVTAGWEERESETEELEEHVCRPTVNLDIWARVERIFREDTELLEAMRERQATWRRIQDLYRLRLEGLMDPTKELLQRAEREDDELAAAAENDAWELVRGLDQQHTSRVEELHQEFYQRVRPAERPAVVRERRAIEAQLQDVACLCIAGGHVSVLLHRLQLFDLMSLWGDRPVVAWSAGAMVLSQQVVLFHDAPPQGSSYAEVMEAGFGLLPGLVALPHAKHRLQAEDSVRVRLLSRRFTPALCAMLDYRTRIDWRGGKWLPHAGAMQLAEDGQVLEMAR
ncbi:MAG: hypothetical protein AB8H80_04895 [Planctomycetota bacterium]